MKQTNTINLTIDGKKVSIPEGSTILEAAQKAGVAIPTLCYLKGLNEIGACRVCSVEVKGLDRLVAACNTPVQEGLEVLTASPRVRKARRTNVQLLLSRHNCRCLTCERDKNCELQNLANLLGLLENPYPGAVHDVPWDASFPLQRDASRCVQCLRCVQVCDKVQGLGVWEMAHFGTVIDVAVSGSRDIKDAHCSLCGQCITHCPTGALTARDDREKVLAALADPDVTTAVQVAPAVRAAWADSLGLSHEKATPERMAAALKALGFDYVFDTNFSADLTIMEEGTEFIHRIVKGNDKNREATVGGQKITLPMFTSCCPGWVRFVKSEYPDILPRLSTAKSPQQMFGAAAKSWFAQTQNIDPAKLFVASIMPCSAKKFECTLPGMDSAGAGPDVDVVLTTREFARMLASQGVDASRLEERPFDQPLGEGTGAAVIFGATGGVMEAALRTVYWAVTGKNPPAADAFKPVRGNAAAPFTGVTSAEFDVAGAKVQVAVVSGLANTRALIEAILAGKAHYDFVEVMACPGGCAGGGGQPISGGERAEERGARLWALDASSPVRFSHENKSVQKLYKEYMGEPCGEKAHHLLHVH